MRVWQSFVCQLCLRNSVAKLQQISEKRQRTDYLFISVCAHLMMQNKLFGIMHSGGMNFNNINTKCSLCDENLMLPMLCYSLSLFLTPKRLRKKLMSLIHENNGPTTGRLLSVNLRTCCTSLGSMRLMVLLTVPRTCVSA